MRILLLAAFDSIAAKDDAITLSARGYEVVTFCDLHHPEYRLNQGFCASDMRVQQNLNVELLEGTLPVVHADVTPKLLGTIAAFCHLLNRPLVAMDQLDTCAVTMTEERIDAANMLDDVPTALSELLELTERAQREVPKPHPFKEGGVPLKQVDREGELEGYAPGARFMLPIEVPTVRKPSLIDRLRNLERWANRMLGNGHWLKNPNTRRRQAPVRPYRLDTGALSTTG